MSVSRMNPNKAPQPVGDVVQQPGLGNVDRAQAQPRPMQPPAPSAPLPTGQGRGVEAPRPMQPPGMVAPLPSGGGYARMGVPRMDAPFTPTPFPPLPVGNGRDEVVRQAILAQLRGAL